MKIDGMLIKGGRGKEKEIKSFSRASAAERRV